MENDGPIVAIVGSARAEITANLEADARRACQELGKELARAGWRIAVYSADKTFIEPDFVTGYIAAITEAAPAKPPEDGRQPVVCIYPRGKDVPFPERQNWGPYFRDEVDASQDWEVSFYNSLPKMEGVLLLGGASSTLIAGHVGLTRRMPTVAVAEFGGSAQKVWEYMVSKPTLVDDEGRHAMARWNADSAKKCVASLNRQRKVLLDEWATRERALAALRRKAAAWDKDQDEQPAYKRRLYLAISCLVLFLLMFTLGLVIEPSGKAYTAITVLGLCIAGAMGATVRMLAPGAPQSRIGTTPVLGAVVGLIFSLLYLLPQLIGDAGFLIPTVAPPAALDAGGAKEDPATAARAAGAVRVQYLAAILVAVLAGLAFDYAFEQLLKRARERTDEIGRNTPVQPDGPGPDPAV